MRSAKKEQLPAFLCISILFLKFHCTGVLVYNSTMHEENVYSPFIYIYTCRRVIRIKHNLTLTSLGSLLVSSF